MSSRDLERDKEIKEQFSFFLERGFSYEYLYEKGGDSACSYIYRFTKGRDYFDVRELSGGEELTFVVSVRGMPSFPSLKYKFRNCCWKLISGSWHMGDCQEEQHNNLLITFWGSVGIHNNKKNKCNVEYRIRFLENTVTYKGYMGE